MVVTGSLSKGTSVKVRQLQQRAGIARNLGERPEGNDSRLPYRRHRCWFLGGFFSGQTISIASMMKPPTGKFRQLLFQLGIGGPGNKLNVFFPNEDSSDPSHCKNSWGMLGGAVSRLLSSCLLCRNMYAYNYNIIILNQTYHKYL